MLFYWRKKSALPVKHVAALSINIIKDVANVAREQTAKALSMPIPLEPLIHPTSIFAHGGQLRQHNVGYPHIGAFFGSVSANNRMSEDLRPCSPVQTP